MAACWTMFSIVILFAALLIPGYILGKTKTIHQEAMLSFSNILMYVAMPFLVFSKLLVIDLKTVGVLEILFPALLPLVVEPLLFLISKLVFKKDVASVFCAIFPNCGFLGIPLAAAMWPDRPEIVLYISIYNVVSTFMLLTMGIFILSGDRKAISIKKTLVSPIFFAIVLGVLASIFNVADIIPNLETYSVTLAQLTTPLAMMSLGYELSKLNIFKMFTKLKVYLNALIKLVISPLITLSLLLLLKFIIKLDIDSSIAFAGLVATAVGSVASAPSLSQKYGADSESTAMLTLGNTLLCVITIPLMYMLYCNIF